MIYDDWIWLVGDPVIQQQLCTKIDAVHIDNHMQATGPHDFQNFKSAIRKVLSLNGGATNQPNHFQ